MSRRRKPQIKSQQEATEALFWRARVLVEMLDALKQPPQMAEPIKRMREALDDYTASRTVGRSPLQLLTCSACGGTCTQRWDGLCKRCHDAAETNDGLLKFAELQS